jgi:YjbE family integral membrane protein
MEYLTAVLGIVVIDLVLSGDNALVIGMAAHQLPARQRRFAILFGGAAAIVLRICLTAIAAQLLMISGLQAVGGALLLWVSFKLLKQEETSDGVKVAGSLRGAIMTILIADVVMSLDNVLGVAAASHGDTMLLLFGLALSMGILMIGGTLVAQLVDRLWWLAYVGSGVIAWTGAELLLKDPLTHDVVGIPESAHLAIAITITAITLIAAHLMHRHPAGQWVHSRLGSR